MKSKVPSRLQMLLIILVIPLGFYFYYKKKIDAIPKIATYWDAPSFKYATQNGDSLSSDSLKGKVYVADFIFTNCESVCPNLSKTMAQLQQNFIDNGDVKLVSFSIDPARDSIQALKDYAGRYGAIRGKWYFLRGDTTTIWNTVEKGFKVSVGYAHDNTGTGYSFTHSEKLVLVDEKGKVRGFYNGLDKAEMDSLYNGIASLMVAKNL
ncbi:MAG TPA: SCO family protein [Chitinophagales bacterium]|nr:SCO family protein [Chitinophagales bacterium]